MKGHGGGREEPLPESSPIGVQPVQPGFRHDSSSARVGRGGAGGALVQRQPVPWSGILTDITRTWPWVADPQSPGARLRILAQGPLPTAGAWVGSGGRRRQGWGWPLGFGVDTGPVGTGWEAAIHSWAWLLWDAPLFQGPSEVVGGPVKREELTVTPLRGFRGKGLRPRPRGGLGELVVVLRGRETLSLERGGPGASCVSLRPGWESPEGAGGWVA